MNQVQTALFEIQGILEPFPKNAKGYTSRYVTLDALLETIIPLLQEREILMTQSVGIPSRKGYVSVTTTLTHSGGDSMEWTAEIPTQSTEGISMNETQAAGAAVKYLRRYHITAIFNVMDGDDDDAATPRLDGGQALRGLMSEFGTERVAAAMAQADLRVIKTAANVATVRAILEGEGEANGE